MLLIRPKCRARCLSLALSSFTFAVLAAAPGEGSAQEFEIDEVAAERALERALVQTGSVLLPPRALEIVPFFGFSRFEDELFGVVTLPGGDVVGTSIEQRQNEFTAGVTLRAGLPWSSQIDLTVPLGYADSDTIQGLGGTTFGLNSESVTGIGDLSLTYSQAFLRERDGLPAVIGSLTWDTDTGSEEDGLSLGSGFDEIEASVIATFTQDPLVFSGRLSYEYAIEEDDIKPGDTISASLDAFLAVNPETSLSVGFTVARSEEFELDGAEVAGSDQLSALLDLGVATILRRNLLMNASFSVGLTDSAPDFAIQVSLPFRTAF